MEQPSQSMPAEQPPQIATLHLPAAHIADSESTDFHVHLPDPSIWPIVIALGIAVLVNGIVLGLPVLVLGLLLIAFGIGGWIRQDILVSLREQDRSHH